MGWVCHVANGFALALLLAAMSCGGRTPLDVRATRPAGDAAAPAPAVDASPTATAPGDALGLRSRWLVFAGTHLVGQASDQLFAVWLADEIGPLQIVANDVLTAAAWSTDGRFLAYVADGGLHVLEPAGPSLVSRWNAVPATADAEPQWSPAAPTVAWIAPAGGGTAVHYAAVDRLDHPKVIGGDRAAKPLGWSADGRYLAFQVASPHGGGTVPALADTWESQPVARPLPHGAALFDAPASGLSIDGRYIGYRGSGANEVWVAPLESPDAAMLVGEALWLVEGGFAEIDPDEGVRSVRWTDSGWELGAWVTTAPAYVSPAGFIAASCPEGYCVGRLSDGLLGTWYAAPLGMNDFSPDGRRVLVQQRLESPSLSPPFPTAMYYIDLGGMWGNLTKLTEFKYELSTLATTRCWSPTSDAFALMLEGGTAGVLAWRVGTLLETWLALPNPHRYRDSMGAWAPGGQALAMAWKDDDGLGQETEVHVFRIDRDRVVAQAALGGVARPSKELRWYWQP